MKKVLIVVSAVAMFAIFSTGCSKKSEECDVISVMDGAKEWARNNKDFSYQYGKGDDLSSLNLTIKVSKKADYLPKGPYNFTNGNITITVTAEAGNSEKFTLKPKQ